jgi:hypothetical protein
LPLVAGTLFVASPLWPAAGDRTLLLRKRPVRLEQGVVSIHRAGEIEIEEQFHPWALQLSFRRIVRDATRPEQEQGGGSLRLAIQMDEADWEGFESRLRAYVEALDPAAFRDPWAGLLPRNPNGDAWTELLASIALYVVTACFEGEDGSPSGFQLAGRSREDGSWSGTRSARAGDAARAWCELFAGHFPDEPTLIVSTFPSTLEEHVQRVGAVVADRTYEGAVAELPQVARLERSERDDDKGSTRHSTQGSRLRKGAEDLHGDGREEVRYQTVDRMIEQRDDRGDLWISSEAEDTAIEPDSLENTRALVVRLDQRTERVRAGVMPPPDERLSEAGSGLVVAVLPGARIAPAKQEQFLRDVGQRLEIAEGELPVESISAVVVAALPTLEVERLYTIVCVPDGSRWSATYHVDEASAKVLNASEVCPELQWLIPTD